MFVLTQRIKKKNSMHIHWWKVKVCIWRKNRKFQFLLIDHSKKSDRQAAYLISKSVWPAYSGNVQWLIWLRWVSQASRVWIRRVSSLRSLCISPFFFAFSSVSYCVLYFYLLFSFLCSYIFVTFYSCFSFIFLFENIYICNNFICNNFVFFHSYAIVTQKTILHFGLIIVSIP